MTKLVSGTKNEKEWVAQTIENTIKDFTELNRQAIAELASGVIDKVDFSETNNKSQRYITTNALICEFLRTGKFQTSQVLHLRYKMNGKWVVGDEFLHENGFSVEHLYA